MDALLGIFGRADNAQTFKAGETIFSEGDDADFMYVVIEGEVELHRNGTVIETLTPGIPMGEMGLIDREPRRATAIAKTDCKVVPVNERQFNFMVAETPNFALTVMRVMSDRIRRTS